MTNRQKIFVKEYLVDLNATQAAIRAGYSEKTAEQIGCRLLRNVKVAEAIQKGVEKKENSAEITAEKVLTELAKIGFANMADYMKTTADGDPYLDFSALSRDQAAALSEVTVEDYVDGRGKDARNVKKVKFKLYDKRAALVDIGKHIGMFKERHEVTGANGEALFEDVLGFHQLSGILARLRPRQAESIPIDQQQIPVDPSE